MEDSSFYKRRKDGTGCAVRYFLCGMLFLGCFLVYAMRINLSVSIVAMINSTTSRIEISNESCISEDYPLNQTDPSLGEYTQGEFNWDETQQSMITYAFFLGYLLSQIPGGYLAQEYSLTWVLGVGIGLTSVLTCLTSVVARFHFYAFIGLRILEGVAEGITFPSIPVFVTRWIPIQEQSLLLNMIVSGCAIGVVVTMPMTALLCKSVLGWPSSFYIFGMIGIVWTIVWFTVAADRPETHRWISESERELILDHRPLSASKQRNSTPWRKILLSGPILCLGITKLASAMNFYMIVTELPNYLNAIYGIDLVDNGFISGGMNLGEATTAIISGALADKILAAGIIRKSYLRKIFTATGTLIPSACMLALPFVGCRYPVVLGLLILNCVMLGTKGGGDAMVALDLAPKYIGTIQGIVNTMANLAGVLAPSLVGYLTEHNNTLTQWNLAFVYTAAFTTIGASVFIIFGSTEEQKWAAEDELETSLCTSNISSRDSKEF